VTTKHDHHKRAESDPPKTYSIKAVMGLTSLSLSSVKNALRDGKLRSVHVGRRRLVLADSVNELLRDGAP
jgi:hypothetical protein